jgi:hypothetical protein
MKRAALFSLLLLATLASAAPNPDEYSINVHVSSSALGRGASQYWPAGRSKANCHH